MRRLSLSVGVISSLLAAAFLVGCQSQQPAPPSGVSFLPDTVTASGSGTVFTAPDEAVITYGVSRSASKADDALAKASKVASDVVEAATALGLEKQDIQTTELSVNPRYRTVNKRRVRAGYSASIETRIMTRNLDLIGKLLDAGTSAGATRVNGPEFQLSARSKVRREALSIAVADAKANAQAMAQGSGRAIGQAVALSDTSQGYGYETGVRYAGIGMTYGGAPRAGAGLVDIVETQPGRLKVTAEVSAVFDLE
ncbi:MAG: SIMPL domain-containing protein [Coriobacteriales bacterium]|nr:SIMPL domain-containing protein [Coriobacteriales bacterium]